MKSNTIIHYVTRVLIYTVIYVVILVLLDNRFNGATIDFLQDSLPEWAFYMIYNNQIITALLVYILGLVILSVIYIIKLSKMLDIASRSICEEEPMIFGDSCPDELREFSQNLKEFKYDLKTNEQARQAAEQQKNDLVVYLAHDLKTPLTSVIGYLSLLEETNDMPLEKRAKYIGIALNKAYRLEQLINEFFEITRLNLQTIPTHKTPVNLTILLIQIINEFFPMLDEKGISITQDIEPEIIAPADADKLARVFDNLFRNAVNYSYANSNIICTAHKEDDHVLITLKNKGDNIPPEKLEHIFDKFYRLDNSRHSSTGGTGLGLAIAKQIIELHSGSIEAACNNGVTEFNIILPL